MEKELLERELAEGRENMNQMLESKDDNDRDNFEHQEGWNDCLEYLLSKVEISMPERAENIVRDYKLAKEYLDSLKDLEPPEESDIDYDRKYAEYDNAKSDLDDAFERAIKETN